MHKPESTQENDRHKILQNLDKQMDRLFSAKGSDLELIDKKKTELFPF